MKTVLDDRRWVSRYPHLGTGPVSAEPSISPAFFELEREKVFRTSWINVGSVADMPQPGDYFVREVAVLHASILLVHGKDGVIRGFHNVCSHRGNKVVWERKGRMRGNFVCNLHCWSYGADGELKSVPDEVNFHDFDKRQHGLKPVRTEVFCGFVFCNLSQAEGGSLREYLGGLADVLEGAEFGQFTRTRSYEFDDHANWKIALDAQNEIYHIPFQHRIVMGALPMMNEKGLARIMDVEFFGPHSRYSVEMNPKYVGTPLANAMMEIQCASESRHRLPMHGPLVDSYIVFPNFELIVSRGPTYDTYMTYNFWPLAVDRTIWECHLYYPAARNAAELLAEELNSTRIRAVLDEDAAAHEAVHAGLKSRAKTHLMLQDEEIQIRHFHHIIEARVAGAAGGAHAR